jgi:hypothetical protein
VRDVAFRRVPELVSALEQLSAEKFPKIMGTDEQSRGADQPDGLVRFVVLRLDHMGSHWAPAEGSEKRSSEILRRPKAHAPTKQRPRRVA